MSIAIEGEVCYAAGSYDSAGFSQAPLSIRQKLAELVSSAAKLSPAGRPIAPPTTTRSAPDESFAIPMREGFLRHQPSNGQGAAPPLASAPIALPSPASSARTTLVGLTPGQIKALTLDEFRACLEATNMRALRPAQLMLIEGDKDLRAIAHDVLNRKARKNQEVYAPLPRPAQSEPGAACVRLPKNLETFIAEQIQAGLYSDAGELICDSLRFFQAETKMHFHRIALERETAARSRAWERRASALDATA
jgi:Arc/MetJ-type ribon-helix-helix transcriptional regulator